ncbi:unnamed protein product [Bracoviriform congregatae]|uniref:Uncharacterized protein n=1 Tax=Bracoviriform congregatae TaxID=39640 RepID=Q5ZNV1_9VIRU|nr:unnamed protein product [Bracoviriform congregatae]CAG24028.1 unnamed protein product [Bracoviriform congregatae]
MLSTKATALLLFAIIGVSVADSLQGRRNNNNLNSELWYKDNPDYQHSINTASQYGQNPGHQNSAADTRRDDRQSNPQKPISNGSLNNQSPVNQKPAFGKPFPEMKPFKVTPDLNMAIKSIDSQRPAGSGSKNYLGSITIQKGNTYNTDPNSLNIYGSVTHLSGSYLSPADQEQLERMNQESLNSDDSNPRAYQTNDGRTVNVHGAVTYQANTDYPSQLPHSTQQSIKSSQTASTQDPAQESPEAQRLRNLLTRVGDLTSEVQNQNAGLRHIQSSIDIIDQLVQRIDRTVYDLWNRAQAHH